MRGPTGVKFCTMVSTRPSLIMPVQNFFFWGGHTTKKFHVWLCPEFLVRSDSLRSGLQVLAQMFYFFSRREISEMRGRTGVKFCAMVSAKLYFIMPIQNFGSHTPKNFGGEKHAKFGRISDDFKVRPRISPKQMKIFKIGFLFRL